MAASSFLRPPRLAVYDPYAHLAPINSGGAWVGIDLDGTLAHHDHWRGHTHIGAPIPAMVAYVRELLARGLAVRVFTARVSTTNVEERGEIVDAIAAWTLTHIGKALATTCVKDYECVEIVDDRARQVERNTGVIIGTHVPSTVEHT
jgi:hypothetical protein